MSIPVTSIVNVSVAQAQAALSNYNVNSLAILSKEVPIQSYGRGGTGTAVLTGTVLTSVTLGAAGSGYSVPPPVYVTGGGGSGALVTAQITAGAITGFTVINGGTNYGSTPTIIVGSGLNVYTDPNAVIADWGSGSETAAMATEIFSQPLNITTGAGVLFIYAMNSGDTLSTALTALLAQAYVGGAIFAGYQPNAAEVVAAGTLLAAQTPQTMLGNPSALLSDLYAGGVFQLVQAATLKGVRGLLYTLTAGAGASWTAAQSARIAAAAYMSRAMSTNFTGAATTATMNLKQLVGILPDPAINTTILTQCQLVGADVYCYVGNLPEVVSTGGNDYTDNVFNLEWLVGALQVALFNALATTPTKIPQTEAGMAVLRSALIQVFEQAVTNGFVAPGTWNGAIPFGSPAVFLQNISAAGYYLINQPIATQSQASRQARQAPLLQAAAKYAGAVQFAQLVVYVQP